MDISKSLSWGYQKLKKKSTSAILDSEVLLAMILKKSKEFLYTYPEHNLTATQLTKFKKLINQRAKGAPIAYLLGYKEFFGLNFIVNKNVLIPRPDTELLVEEVTGQIKKTEGNKKIILIDAGTGSGCIPVVIGKRSFDSVLRTPLRMTILATDISASALTVARHNAQKNKVKIKFFQGNLLEPLSKILYKNSKAQIFITANLPYLTTKQMKEKTIQKEPRLALYGGKDGLELYQKLLQQIQNLKLTPATIFLEIDPSQKQKILTLIKKILPNAKAEIKKDLAKKNRLVIIKN
ncbi:MAG: peptide chain release factor N(5)-glutamine methyltransferase [Candidatus Magasanikbacteria bacterium]|nr:peptide chain release factor N(5)-glutamine methyltransferase [Candidatus Magasanikbacteria bacterium]